MPKLFFILFAIIVLISLFPTAADAQGLVPCGNEGQPACSLCHTFVLGSNILNVFLFPIVPIIAAFLIAVAGFFLFTAAGSLQGIQRARQVATATVVGLVIIYGAWLFVNLLLSTLGVTIWSGVGSWWEIDCPLPLSISLTGPSSVVDGGDITLTWTIFGGVADTCDATGIPGHADWTGGQSTTSDSRLLSTVTGLGTKEYTLTCSGPGGNAVASVEVEVTVVPPAPILSFGGPASVVDGGDITLTWTVSGGPITSCIASGVPGHADWIGPQSITGGSRLLSPVTGVGTKRYTLNCSGPGGNDSDFTDVTVTPGAPTVITFNYTGGSQTWTVPVGITSIDVDARGAQGAMGGSLCISTNLVAKGGRVQATLTVVPGEILSIWIGGRPLSCPSGTPCSLPSEGTTIGGFNGGGSGGTGISCIGRGGGGASDVRQGGNSISDRVVVAAGGGGASGSSAGEGGGLVGGDRVGVAAGKGATQIVGGAGGLACVNGGTDGANGSLAQGGNGGNSVGTTSGRGGGGGGGGGYYGGGGGAGTHDACGGGGTGGGGSSLVPPGGSTTAGFHSGHGQIIITY